MVKLFRYTGLSMLGNYTKFCSKFLLLLLPSLGAAFYPFAVSHASEKVIDPAEQLEREVRQKTVQKDLEERVSEQVHMPKDYGLRFKAYSGCIPIKKIKIVGDNNLKKLFLDKKSWPIISAVLYRCLNSAELNDLVLKLNAQILAKGYITARVEIAEYDRTSGELIIKLQAGHIEKIEAPGLNTFNLFPGLVGRKLKAQDLDQGLEQANRLPSRVSVITLWPGSDIGETIVKIDTKKIARPYRLYLAFDNTGNRQTGQNVCKGSFFYDDLLSINDQLFISGSKSGWGSKRSGALIWKEEIPFGYYTFSYSGSYSDSSRNIQSGDAPWDFTAQGFKNKLALSRNIYRDANHQILLDGSFWHYVPKRKVMGVSLYQEQKLSVFEIEFQHNFYHEKFRILTALNCAQGVGFLGAQEYAENYAEAHTKFRRYKLTSDYLWKFTRMISLNGNVQLQYGQAGLPDLVKLPVLDEIGGIRGLKESTLVQDDGIVLRHDLIFSVPFFSKAQNKLLQKVTITPFLHGDIGWSRDKGDKNELKQFLGIGGGIRLNILDFNGKLTCSRLVKQPNSSAVPGEGWVFLFELNQKLL